MRGSPTRCFRKRMTQDWGNFREERPDIGVEYVVHLLAADPDDERIQRIVLTALGSESIREPEEVFLVDRAQHRRRGPLDDFVFRAATASGRLLPSSFGM